MRDPIGFHSSIVAKYPRRYLYSICILVYLFSYLIPAGLGAWDYAINSTLAVVIYAAAYNVWHLKVAKYVFWLELSAVLLAFMAYWDGYLGYIGPFFDHYDTILGVINSLELLVMIQGIPRDAIFSGVFRDIKRTWANRSIVSEPDYGRKNVVGEDFGQEAAR